MPLSYISVFKFFFLQGPHLASKSFSQALLSSLKNVSYSLGSSHPRKIEGLEGPQLWEQGHRGELLLRREGERGLCPQNTSMLLKAMERIFGKHHLRSIHSYQFTGTCKLSWQVREIFKMK